MIAEPVVQQAEPPHQEIEGVGVADRALPEGQRRLGRRPRRHRHVAQGEPVALGVEVGFVGAPQAPHLGAADVIGDEGHDDGARPVERRQRLGAQHDLVETVTAHAAVQDPPAGDPLQVGGPALAVAHFLAEGEGIAHREDRRLVARGRRTGRAQPVAVDRDAGGGIAGARPVAQPLVVHRAAIVGLGQHLARVEHVVRPGEQPGPGRGAHAQLDQAEADRDRDEDQDGAAEKLGARALRVGRIHRSGML